MSTLLHVLKYPPGQGGMDNIQGLHLKQADESEQFFSLLRRPDNRANEEPAVRMLASGDGGPWTSWATLRRRFARFTQIVRTEVTVYYNCWGADVLADVDPAKKRIGYLHSDFPRFDDYVRHFAPGLDGFLCVSEGLAEKVRRCLPDWPAERVACAPIMSSTPGAAETVSPAERALIIGFAGRLVREQKRVDRLPEFLRELDEQGVRGWRMEILGDGPERGSLERVLAGDARVGFLGWSEAAATRAAMERWRYQVTLSDYEGLSVALLEAAAAGCLPVYPQFNDPGSVSDLPAAVAPGCLYAKGDLAAAAEKIVGFERTLRERPEELARVQAGLRAFAAERTEENYLRFWVQWRAALEGGTARAARPGRRLTVWEKLSPVWVYNRRYRAWVHGRD